jgi:hypothetical protein
MELGVLSDEDGKDESRMGPGFVLRVCHLVILPHPYQGDGSGPRKNFFMLIKKADDIRSSEVTPRSWYSNRRTFLAGLGAAGAAAGIYGVRELIRPSILANANTKIDGIQKSPLSTTEAITPYKDVTNYNNYYEFSTDKYEPANLAKNFRTRPWAVETEVRCGQHSEDGVARGTDLPSSMCRGLVDRRTMGGIFAEHSAEESRTAGQSAVCAVHYPE